MEALELFLDTQICKETCIFIDREHNFINIMFLLITTARKFRKRKCRPVHDLSITVCIVIEKMSLQGQKTKYNFHWHKKLENLRYIQSQHTDARVPNCVKSHEGS